MESILSSNSENTRNRYSEDILQVDLDQFTNQTSILSDSDEIEPENELHLNNNNNQNIQINNLVPSEAEETRPGRPTDVSTVIDMLFEIHTALKSKHLGKRTAASALAACNIVSKINISPIEPETRDEQLEILENTRKMLECSICQDIFTDAMESTCCGQIYCKICIERWVAERGTCPMCRDPISFSMLIKSRHIQRMANEMKVYCQYCIKYLKKSELLNHIIHCDKAPIEPPPPMDVALRRFLWLEACTCINKMRNYLISPISPIAKMTQCYIRTYENGKYELYSQENDILIGTAIRRRQLDMSVIFTIYMAFEDYSSNDNNIDNNNNNLTLNEKQIGKLERNFVGSQYTIYSVHNNNDHNNNQNHDHDKSNLTEIGAVQYAATFGKTPRQMQVALPIVSEIENDNNNNDETDENNNGNNNIENVSKWEMHPLEGTDRNSTMLGQIEKPNPSCALHLINKPPVWIESLEAYCLDFGGRVSAASVKNFLLSHPDDMDKTIMLFGRTADRQVYSMDFQHPFSPLQAFSIALSSMDSHLVTFD